MFRRKKWMQAVDAARVEAAIRAAEQRTSGEIRVSVAPFFWNRVEREAELAFQRLGMTRTKERNGVLIFVVPSRKRFVIRGDEGIHTRAGQPIWDEAARVLTEHFKRGAFTDGLVVAIERIGEALATHFPHQRTDVNELPDTVDMPER